MKRLLQNRALLTLAAADFISTMGSWVTTMALFSIVVFQGGGGLAATSGMLLAGLLPSAVCGPLAGWLADRFPSKVLMISSQVIQGLLVTALIFTERLAFIYPLLVLQSAVGALMSPARQTLVPQVVAAEDLTRANALLLQFGSTVKIAAPFLSGLLLAALPAHHAMVLDVISFALSAFLLARLPRTRKQVKTVGDTTTTTPDSAAPRSLGEIARAIPLLRALLPIPLLAAFVFMTVDTAFATYTRDVLVGDQRFLGLTVGAVGLGTLLGSTYLMLSKKEREPVRDILLGEALLILVPLAFVLATLFPQIVMARTAFVGCLFLGALGMGLANVQSQTLIQRLTPAGWLGRITGVMSSLSAGGALAGLLGTPLLIPHVLSFRWFFALDSTLLIALVAFTALAVRRQRTTAASTNEVSVGGAFSA